MPIISVDDTMFDFAAIELAAKGQQYTVKDVKYECELDGVIVMANSQRPVGRTLGRLKCTASMTMYLAEHRRLVKNLGQGFMRVIFPITVKYAVPGVDIIYDTLLGCRMGKMTGGGSEGAEALTGEIPLQIMGILWNGLDPLGEALTTG